MNRRGLIEGSVGVAAGTIAAPAIVHAQAAFRSRLVTSWPKSLDTIHGTAEAWARRVGQMTNGKLQISVHARGELVPALQVFDAVQNGTLECGDTYSAFYISKNTAYAFDGGLAFGMNGRQQCAWYHQGGVLRDLRGAGGKETRSSRRSTVPGSTSCKNPTCGSAWRKRTWTTIVTASR